MTDLINNVYFDKIRYILVKISDLNLSSQEVLVVLSIILLQEQGSLVSVETLVKQTNLDNKEVDDIVTLLASKRYLEVIVTNGRVNFSIDNIFSLKEEANIDVKDIFKIFEDEFSRILNQRELVRLNEWTKVYTREEILDGLRSASIMSKLDFNYINKILENNRNESN